MPWRSSAAATAAEAGCGPSVRRGRCAEPGRLISAGRARPVAGPVAGLSSCPRSRRAQPADQLAQPAIAVTVATDEPQPRAAGRHVVRDAAGDRERRGRARRRDLDRQLGVDRQRARAW